MGSETTPKLPIIDFSNLNLDEKSPNWEAVKSQVYKALVEYGCFEAIFDKVPSDHSEALFSATQDLFDLPLKTKSLVVSKILYRGYNGQIPNLPLYESMTIGDANVYEKVESITNILWPNGNPTFSKTIQSFTEELSELDQFIRKMILESLGVEKHLEEHMNSTNYLLRLQKYIGPKTSETEMGLFSHTDKNLMTILCQNQVEGLEVLTKDGKWISYKPSPNSFVVVIGDSFHAWSNGKLHSPFHRVMMTGNEVRYSAGLFIVSKEGYIVKAPEELVDEKHPLLFKPFDYVEFLKYHYTTTIKGQTDQASLHAYCGV